MFLHGNLEEEVHMEAPLGLDEGFKYNSVCRVKMTLYESEQSLGEMVW